MMAASSVLLWCLILSALPKIGLADDLTLAKGWNDSADQYMAQGAYEDARRLYSHSLPILEKTLGPEHPISVTTMGNLCDASVRASAYLDAKPLCARALALRQEVFGPNHPEVARSLSDLGLLYANEGDLSHAESLLRRALQIDSSVPDSPDIPTLLNNLGFLYSRKKKYTRAEDFFERGISATERARGPEDPALIPMLSNVATVCLANRQFRAAEQNFRRSLAIAERTADADQVSSVQALVGLTRAEAALGRGSEARTFLHRAQNITEQNRQASLEWGKAIEVAHSDLVRK
jgi:tetratricopeptide (TPR) repeat protein